MDKQSLEINDGNHQLGDLKRCLDEKHRQQNCLSGELASLKALLGDKCLDSHKQRELSGIKGLEVDDNRARLAALQSEIE